MPHGFCVKEAYAARLDIRFSGCVTEKVHWNKMSETEAHLGFKRPINKRVMFNMMLITFFHFIMVFML